MPQLVFGIGSGPASVEFQPCIGERRPTSIADDILDLLAPRGTSGLAMLILLVADIWLQALAWDWHSRGSMQSTVLYLKDRGVRFKRPNRASSRSVFGDVHVDPARDLSYAILAER